jgi:hypothetical protein
MQTRTAVKIARAGAAERVIDALVLAFSADPVTRYAFPEPTQLASGSARSRSLSGARRSIAAPRS